MDENDKARYLAKQAARFRQLWELNYGRRRGDWPNPPAALILAAGIPGPRGAARDHSCPAGTEGQPRPDLSTDAVDAAASKVLRARTHLLRRLIIVLVLALASLATGVWAILLFPDRPPITNPTPFSIGLRLFRSDYTLGSIYVNISPGTESVKVTVRTFGVESAPKATEIGILFIYIRNSSFPVSCSSGASCFSKPETVIMVPISTDGWNYIATIKDPRFGFTSNGESAIVELPAVEVEAGNSKISSTATVNVEYVVRNADTYDWSLPPANDLPGGSATWIEPLSKSFWEPEATEITGTNHQAQAQDDRDTFIAGILLGVAGGAVIAAVQEGLHMLLDNRNDSKLPKPT